MKYIDIVASPKPNCAGGGVVYEVTPTGPASPPSPLRMARGVVCEVTPTGLLAHFVEFFFSQNSHI